MADDAWRAFGARVEHAHRGDVAEAQMELLGAATGFGGPLAAAFIAPAMARLAEQLAMPYPPATLSDFERVRVTLLQ